MANIQLERIAHSYDTTAKVDSEWAIKPLDLTWSDGGSYALLGPSGCGKTSLLNIISGLIKPTQGRVLFDDRDVTNLGADDRHIAQVFQFPVVYDTMSVFDNLAFPLRNRGVSEADVSKRVLEISAMLDLEDCLTNRASGLTADGKQKISLGRGLVRSDVNVMMFDEPLTVIDPQLKYRLRSKLKELHQQLGVTTIYVTHDQTEALTFAEQVVVMNDGGIVQIGTPKALFNRPEHTFVGYFIGSPGMNVLPCRIEQDQLLFDDNIIETQQTISWSKANSRLELGIRPEFVTFSSKGIPVTINRVDDTGRHQLVEVQRDQYIIKILLDEQDSLPSDSAFIEFSPEHVLLYSDGRLI